MASLQPAGSSRAIPLEPLIARARDGSRSSLGRLLATYRPYLLVSAHDQLRQAFHCKVSPSDVVQKTMHDAITGMPRFRGRTQQEFVAWLLQILRHRIIDVVRRYSGPEQDIRREVSIDGDSSHAHGLPIIDLRRPEASAEEADERSRIWAGVECLSPRDQAVLALRFKLDASWAEIAEVLGITEGAARKRVNRAVRRLTTLIQSDGKQP